MINIIVDTLGSDNGSHDIIEAIKQFLKDNKDVHITAVGNEEELKELKDLCEIVHAPDIVPMEAGPLETLRLKNSSLYVAHKLLKDRRVKIPIIDLIYDIVEGKKEASILPEFLISKK